MCQCSLFIHNKVKMLCHSSCICRYTSMHVTPMSFHPSPGMTSLNILLRWLNFYWHYNHTGVNWVEFGSDGFIYLFIHYSLDLFSRNYFYVLG